MSVKINHYAKLPCFFFLFKSVSSFMQRESLTAQHTQVNHKNEQGVSKCDSLSGNAVIVYQEGVGVCMVCVAHLMLRNIRMSFSL